MPTDKIDQLRRKRQRISLGGGQERIDKQHEKGKLTARERLQYLFDANSFVELDAFVACRCTNFGMDKLGFEGESVVTGYGRVDGRLVYAFSQDFTVTGGALGEMHARKVVKAMDAAVKVGAPIVGLNDSGGARIQEAVDALSGYGEIFYRNAIYSGVIPQISAVMGPCAGGAVYSPALTDFIFMVDRTSQMFITGPQVISTVTGEQVSAEDLGGALTHNKVSGNAHFIAESDRDCLAAIRQLLGYLPGNNMENPPRAPSGDDPNRMVEAFDTIIPETPNKPYDMHEIIKLLVDDGRFLEYQALFAPNLLTALARIDGRPVGIIANQPAVMAGCLDINAGDKAARFIRTCSAFNLPLLTFVDVPGFLPGAAQEYGGIIRHGAKILYAYSEATVPKLTVITRKAYGGAYVAMCSKSLGADLVFAWPTAEIAVMGSEGAVNIIFKKDLDRAEDKQAAKQQILKNYEAEFATPYKAAERGFVDDVIEPRTTRQRVIDGLVMLAGKRERRPAKVHGNIPL
ncbi:acyl-CoA carboxylase subunit beta [Desulfofustis glycolicus]|uniref:Propionyl-CoA carboxylase beta chain n=1 Tax=Desulfofustis glycolicus DSM 9705 TaxID=1121409 RepID=A0A1M5RWA4_9BACT|nr:acyl-CoA carboxylase subunit beta [Desulfofustis glycolicus]MCB2216353.1 methylmalonyl-CoA carboxyltransferase [Desulfobulbaceae bacterium]SHH30526.1 Acetyl-CoA carboxylase, carboxyltransferase component [Desulfofustis glycolicus DSM 9705]